MKIAVYYYIFLPWFSFCFLWCLMCLLPFLELFLLMKDNIYYQIWGCNSWSVLDAWGVLSDFCGLLLLKQFHIYPWGKVSLQLINVIISMVRMHRGRHRDSDKPSCRQPCGRVCSKLSHDVSTAEDRFTTKFPSPHPQNKELLFFQTHWDYVEANTMYLGSLWPDPLIPLIPVAPELPSQM